MDAVAFVLDLWEFEFDFCRHTCDIEASDVCSPVTHIYVSDKELEIKK